jgi:hypothetical protein
MTKRRIHHILDGDAADIIGENAEHEGHPRTASAERAQESWEEFKEKSNLAAEAVIDEITHPAQLRTRAKKVLRRTRGFYLTYKTYFWIAGALALIGTAYAVAMPVVAKKRRERVDLGFA